LTGPSRHTLNVDVIVTAGTPAIRAVKNATTTIPVVMATSGDPVGFGFVASLARPGGNITGSSNFGSELSAKRLELLKERLPRAQRVAVLLNPENSINERSLRAMERTAKALKVGLRRFEVRGADAFKGAFSAMALERVEAVVLPEDDFLNANRGAIAELVTKQRLPSIGRKEFAEAGGLIGYGVNRFEENRRATIFVGKILKGAKPGDLPIERAAKFQFIVNLKTAKALGITIPPSILVRADEVIE
jgi:ABC-type uncharacterized transport system substrate-binding protein